MRLKTVLAAAASVVVIAGGLVGSPALAATPYHASVGVTGLSPSQSTEMGKTVTISGKVWGGPVKGQKVSIYIANIDGVTGFNRRLAVVPILSGNRYTYRWKTDDSGTFQLRVVKGAYQGHTAVKVTSKVFRAYRWVSRSPYGGNGGGYTVAGQPQPTTAFIVKHAQDLSMYTQRTTCTTFRMKLGMSDASTSSSGALYFYNSEVGPVSERFVFSTTAIKGQAMRPVTLAGEETALYGAAFRGDFGPSGSASDAFVLADLEQYCVAPVKNQWNPTGYHNDEGLTYYCVGEQVAEYGGRTRCKIDP